METAAHPRILFKPRTFGMMFVILTSSASLRTGVVKTFRCPHLIESLPTIIVLEDDARRSNEMRRVIANSPPPFEVLFFDNAHDLLRWFPDNIGSVAAASLDCDLDTTTARESVDAGSGADVADYLAPLTPHFPVVIHSSNAMRAPAMHMTLGLAGWPNLSLAPYTDADSWLAGLLQMVTGNSA